MFDNLHQTFKRQATRRKTLYDVAINGDVIKERGLTANGINVTKEQESARSSCSQESELTDNANFEQSYFTMRILSKPFIASVGLLPLAAFVFCVLLSIIKDFKESTEAVCPGNTVNANMHVIHNHVLKLWNFIYIYYTHTHTHTCVYIYICILIY